MVKVGPSFPKVVVVLPNPDNSPESLLAAWRFCSNEKVAAELSEELSTLAERKAMVDRFQPINGPLLSSYRASLYRVEQIKYLQKLRNSIVLS